MFGFSDKDSEEKADFLTVVTIIAAMVSVVFMLLFLPKE